MASVRKIVTGFLLLSNSLLFAQPFDPTFHKARLSKAVNAQIEGIFVNAGIEYNPKEIKAKTEKRVGEILDFLAPEMKKMTECDTSEAERKKCEEFWKKEEAVAGERAKKGSADFSIAEQKLWAVIMVSPSTSMSPYNTWLKYYLKYEYKLEMDIPIVPDQSYFSLILREPMYQIGRDRFGRTNYVKPVFAMYYNYCGSVLEEKSKNPEEYKKRISLVDSLIHRALQQDSVAAWSRDRAADVYHSLAQNFMKYNFISLGESKGEEVFKLVESLFLKSIFYKADARVYHNFALHYYNHGVDLINGMNTDASDKEIERVQNKALAIFKKCKPVFEKACELDRQYCNYPKIPE